MEVMKQLIARITFIRNTLSTGTEVECAIVSNRNNESVSTRCNKGHGFSCYAEKVKPRRDGDREQPVKRFHLERHHSPMESSGIIASGRHSTASRYVDIVTLARGGTRHRQAGLSFGAWQPRTKCSGVFASIDALK
jgi:hypothetical protein